MKSQVQSLLEDDHDSLNQLLHEIDAELETASPRAIELLDLFWARLAMHIRAEHLHLFPAIADAAESRDGNLPMLPEVKEALGTLRSDHDFFMKELADMMKIVRESGVDTVARDLKLRLSGIRTRLESHNAIEERQVYVWAASLSDENPLHTYVTRELEHLPPRFGRK